MEVSRYPLGVVEVQVTKHTKLVVSIGRSRPNLVSEIGPRLLPVEKLTED